MKRTILTLLAVSTLSYTFAADNCLDLAVNLSRGSSAKAVLQLQNFLFAKGLLKVAPNGYFGPGTYAAVKAYQKNNGLSQVGNTGPATRAAIKKESCATSWSVAPVPTMSTTTTQTSATTTQVQIISPTPVLDSVDLVTLFSGADSDWNVSLHGSQFSSTTNTVIFKGFYTGKVYTIGTFGSSDLATIVLPKNLSNTVFPCGINCNEKLQPGAYEITVTNSGGTSAPRGINIKSFTSSIINNAANGAIPAAALGTKLATLTFSPSEAVTLQNVTFNILNNDITPGGINNIVLKDEATGSPLAFSGTQMSLSPFQSVIIGVYADTSNTKPGTITASFTIQIQDYLGKKVSSFKTDSFMVTVAGSL